MDLSLPIFTLFSSPFCMKCIEFTTRTYNFKNLAVGLLVWTSVMDLVRVITFSKNLYVHCSLVHFGALGQLRLLGPLAASGNKNKINYNL